MAETIRDAIINLTLKVNAPKQAVKVDTSEAKKQVNDLFGEIEKGAQKQKQAMTSLAKEIEQAQRDSAKAQEDAMRRVDAAQDRIRESNVKLMESYRTMGDGAFTAARGIALTFAANDEDAQKMLQTIVKIQGAFDMFKGTTDVIKGFVEAKRAMKVATEAAAAATLKSAAADVVETRTSYANARANAAQAAAQGGVGKAGRFGGVAKMAGSVASTAGAGLAKVAGAISTLPVALAAAIATAVYLTATKIVIPRVFDENGLARESKRLDIETSFSQQNANLNRMAGANTLKGVTNAERAISAQIGGPGDQQQLYAQLNELASTRAQIESDNAAKMLAQLDAQKQQLSIAQQILESEKAREEGIQRMVGAMSAADLIELDMLLKKVEANEELTRLEALRLQQIGGEAGAKIAGETFRKRAGRSGIDERLDALTEDKEALDEANGIIAQFGEVLDGETGAQAIARMMEELAKATKAAQERQTAAIETMIEQQRQYKLALDRLALQKEKETAYNDL